MKVWIKGLSEPLLEFGNRVISAEPRIGLCEGGPLFSNSTTLKEITLGVVGNGQGVDAVRQFIDRMHDNLVEDESNILRFKNFPGVKVALRSSLIIPDRFVRVIDEATLLRFRLLAKEGLSNIQFEDLLKVYQNAITSLFGDSHPDCIIVHLPDEFATLTISNPLLSVEERQMLEREQDESVKEQLSLFEQSKEALKASEDLLIQSKYLLYRNFHRALKARCMSVPNPIPLQIIREGTVEGGRSLQSSATIAWNLGGALFYKAGNIPWRPKEEFPGVCFVGITFHHLKRRDGDIVYASVAQAFSTEAEPFALKGANIPYEQRRDKSPYLAEEQAKALLDAVIQKYQAQLGFPPSRIVLHKSSPIQPEEQAGFSAAAARATCDVQTVHVSPTGFRLLRPRDKEPYRGTLCGLKNCDSYLFTTGYVKAWREYPGPHIPAPLRIVASDADTLEERAREILVLSKMNWNSTDGIGLNPITISFSRRVGMMMTEMDGQLPNPLYRFYM